MITLLKPFDSDSRSNSSSALINWYIYRIPLNMMPPVRHIPVVMSIPYLHRDWNVSIFSHSAT